MIEREIEIATAEGLMNAHVVHPEEGGPFPSILLYMDAPGIRQELLDIASRIATVGYFVLLPNLYYRTDRTVDFSMARMADPATRDAMLGKVRGLSMAMMLRDTRTVLDHLDREPLAGKGPLGAVGYCMSGRWVFGAAAAYPDRFKAVASVYGTGLHTDAPDSPHRTAGSIKGEVYFACAENDSYVPLAQIDALRRYLAGTALNHRIEIYPGTQHGFVFADRGHYHRAGAERHWERVFALLERNLKSGAG